MNCVLHDSEYQIQIPAQFKVSYQRSEPYLDNCQVSMTEFFRVNYFCKRLQFSQNAPPLMLERFFKYASEVISEVYSEHFQTSKIGRSTKIVNG